MEIEEERRRAGGFEDADRIAPMIPASAAHREAVKRDEGRGIRTRDQRAPDDILLVARELAPEGRLQIDVFADRDRADVGRAAASAVALSSVSSDPLRTSKLR